MKEYTLSEENGHIIYYAEYGNVNGPAVISFHGGPGESSKSHHAERFNLEKYRVILFDQRGCGKSTPLGKVEHNTTQDIVHDAERIRIELGIETWFVSGSSWGATCALLYAIAYPNNTQGLLLSSVFMAHKRSDDWLMARGGAGTLMPDVWARRMTFFEEHGISIENQHTDLFKAFEKAHADVEMQQRLTAGIFDWEGNIFSVGAGVSYTDPTSLDEKAITVAKLFVYFASNDFFIPDNYILDNATSIQHIPTVVVQGRHDLICPARFTYELTEKLTQCEFIFADASGHRLTAEAHTIRKMAFDRMLERYTKKKTT